ncbi:hypothetical protein [Flavobacterium lacisediminis]|uniref:MFS transporter n=1 Tax=Flavobacterium lacisediminis TaxID=2989705 RepID=A0ABT3EJZ1_9FLAO|nr:hypothetical protein [Flavobacterium lacisediminis]MCW1148445.1 hypothetical protein [Flavobacterium lacisediminis]
MEKNKLNKKTIDKINDALFFIFCLTGIIYFLFFQSVTIGGDYKYFIYVFLIPTLIGFFLIARFTFFAKSWKSIFNDLLKEKYLILKFIYPFLLITSNFIFSYIFFGNSANIIWDTINKLESKKNKTEKYFLPITKIYTSYKYKDKIRFVFLNNEESISVKYSEIKPFLNKNTDNLKIEIKVKKGIWDNYILESWEIKEVINH